MDGSSDSFDSGFEDDFGYETYGTGGSSDFDRRLGKIIVFGGTALLIAYIICLIWFPEVLCKITSDTDAEYTMCVLGAYLF